ncbi:hypothetical protein HanXRQr2_Chr09g0398221 [Helianthus annuus]|uniref:Uncharacterized protein n=1 Tax=Helianthus annuus TaxID=4232 RepID=A0A9K3I7L5_HELAN|nr:hypothetical protein HanXRQr2_Chr09g0398221 [Helianthus annuus]KAJ0893987.1 hypothetical protein HanPSC8_Chr09g0383971 [Helianthus annuus]
MFTNGMMDRGVQKTRDSQLARNSLEKRSKKARLEIGSVVNEPGQLGSVCKRAELELDLARLVSWLDKVYILHCFCPTSLRKQKLRKYLPYKRR